MPFDGIFTSSVVSEISLLINSKINKIQQPAKDEILLYFKENKQTIKLLLCCNPSFPRLHITEQVKENPKTAPNFCMILRKYLVGGRIVEINQVNFDRIVEFKIESKNELGYPTVFFLIIEIMGKHSNIILLNKNKEIVDSIKHLGSSVNRFREVLPGVPYVLPPDKGKVSPLITNPDYLINRMNENTEVSVAKFLCDNFLGISKLFANEVSRPYSQYKIGELSMSDRENISSNFYYYMDKVKSSNFNFIIYYSNGTMHDYYSFFIEEYNGLSLKYFESPSKLLDEYYGDRDIKINLKQKFNDLFKLISNLTDRCNKKIQIFNNKLEECCDYNKWKIFGDLIMANQYLINDKLEQIEVQNFYDENYSPVCIPLEIGLTAVENAQKYYKKYTKEKTTKEMVSKQLKESMQEKEYLESIMFNLENASDMETIEEIRYELSNQGYIKRKSKNIKNKKSMPYHYKSSDGYDIYVGKNNHQNDFLTTKFAVSSDIWMHTKNIHGSHVIIKSKNGKISENTLLEGALLAAYHSKAKHSTNVPVDYTEKKNVKKPSGAKPGMVIYYTNKTIYVTPTEENIKKMQEQITS